MKTRKTKRNNTKYNEYHEQAFLYSIDAHCYAKKMNKAIIARDFASAESFASLADNAVMRTRQYLNGIAALASGQKMTNEKEA